MVSLQYILLNNMEDFWKFVEKHRNDDPARLRLKYHGSNECWIEDAITHIECMRKCGNKFGEAQPELMLSTLSVEQATSERVAQLHGEIACRLIGNPHNILDMTCGLGIDLHALSGTFQCHSTGIEINPNLANAATYNFRNNPLVDIVNADSVKWLESLSDDTKFDLIFIDPARRGDVGQRLFNIHHCQPDVAEMLPLLADKCRYAMVKLSPMLDVTQTLRDLPPITELHIVDDNGECRELLAVLDFTSESRETEPLITVHSEDRTLSFTPAEERQQHEQYGNALAGMWLFEPSPACMKARPFATLCQCHGLRKLHPNTNLFVNDTTVYDLPGKWYEIEEVADFASSVIKTIGKRIPKADIAARNFPFKAEELQRRLKIKSGGQHRIIGATIGEPRIPERHVLLVLRKM